MGVFKKVFLQLKVQLEAASFPIDVTAFSLLFQESLLLQTLDFSGDPIQGVQIMGMLESRALDFDDHCAGRKKLLNVNEGVTSRENDQSFFLLCF